MFALDPVTEEQNIAEVSSRRRELQLALSLKFVGGGMSGNSLTQFARRLEMDLEVISLNRTIVGFSHGNDTFGWRFAPRVQTPPPPSTVGAFFETLVGGPSREHDISLRTIEPGQRECVAIVLMPSFVPYCDFDVRSNWFRLVNTKDSELEMHDVMKLSRSIKAMQTSSAMCIQCAHLYRDGEVDRLMRRVHQLDRELPLQTMRVQIPYENTLGGFEMFNTGLTDLAPELVGWYGAPGVVIAASTGSCKATPCPTVEAEEEGNGNGNGNDTKVKFLPVPPCPGEGTTLFLVGNNFSVHDTRVLAGGTCIPEFRLISRQIMQVTIPSCVNTVTIDGEQYVDVHAATPYGVTSHLHIPVLGKRSSKTAQEQIDALKKQVESDQLTLVPTELKGVFAYEKASGNLDMTQFKINFDGNEKVVISNTRYQGTAKLLSKPDRAKILFQAVKSDDGPISKDVFAVLGGGGYTFHPIKEQLILERQQVVNVIAKLLVDQNNPLSLNGYHNGGKETLSFLVRLYVQLDEDARPLKVDNDLKVTLTHRKTKSVAAVQGAANQGAAMLRLPPVSEGRQLPAGDLGPRLESSAQLPSTPTLSFR